MTKNVLKNFEKVVDLVDIAGSLQPLTAVMAGGERVEDLLLVESARDHGIINRIVLVGKKHLISDAVDKVGIHVAQKDVLAAENDDEAAAITADLVRTGVVHMVLKGSTPTHVLHRHMLPLAIRNTVSLVSIFDAAPIANGRPMILTDAGVTTVCNYARIAGLIQNSVDVARAVMQIEKPRVALLSANEKILPTLASTQLGAAFSQRGWPDAYVYGPLSLDLATDPGAVASKGLPNVPGAYEVAGKADILVCPNIDTGNVIYKMISAMIKYGVASLANIIMGFPKPYVLLSRSDALETRLNSVALGAIYAQSGLGKESAPAHSVPHIEVNSYHIIVVTADATSITTAFFENDLCVQCMKTDYDSGTVKTPKERQRCSDELTQNILDAQQTLNWKTVDAIVIHSGLLPDDVEKDPEGVCILADFHEERTVVNEPLVSAMRDCPEGQNAEGLIVPVVISLAKALKTSAYAVQPETVNEPAPEGSIAGSRKHLLRIHAAAYKAAKAIGRPLAEIDLVVAHLGDAMTFAIVHEGCISEVNAVSSTNDTFQKEDKHLVEAMTSRIAREIGALYVAAGCDVEAIVFTGDMMRNTHIRNELKKRVGRLAPVVIFDQSLEEEALAVEALGILTGNDQPDNCHRKQEAHIEKGETRHD